MLYDLFGALASLLSTYYFIRLDTKAWAIGLLATCLNGWLYWQKGIYADMWLESFYFISICYGWYRWSKQQRRQTIATVKHSSVKQLLYLCIAVSVLYILIFNLLIKFSHSTVANLDALTTALSIVAQGLMCYKMIATWVLWFIADALYAWMYAQKALPFHTLLMIVYTSMAVVGYRYWLKKRGPSTDRLVNHAAQQLNVPMA